MVRVGALYGACNPMQSQMVGHCEIGATNGTLEEYQAGEVVGNYLEHQSSPMVWTGR